MSDAPPPSTETLSPPAPTPRRWFKLTTLVVVVHVLLVEVPYTSFLTDIIGYLWTESLDFAIAMSQPVLLASWMFWGRTHFLIRFTIIAFFPLLHWVPKVLHDNSTYQPEYFTIFFLLLSVPVWCVLQMNRLRIVMLPDEVPRSHHQYGIQQLLLFMLTCCVWLSIARVTLGNAVDMFRIWGVDLMSSRSDGRIIAGISIVCWATLIGLFSDGKRFLLPFTVGVLGVGLLLSTLLQIGIAELLNNGPEFLSFVLLPPLLVGVSILPFRLAGYRLRRVPYS